MRQIRWFAAVVLVEGCSLTLSSTQGDAGLDAARDVMDVPPSTEGTVDRCAELTAIDLTREGTFSEGGRILTGRVDTRAHRYAPLPLPLTACVRQPRVRGQVFSYVPTSVDPVFVRFDGGRVEVFSGCGDGAALLSCGNGWTPPLRVGTPVLIVVSDLAEDADAARTGVTGALQVIRARPLALGDVCVGPSEQDLRLCGPGLICRNTHCVQELAPPPCTRAPDSCPAGQRCSAQERCEVALAEGEACGPTGAVCAEGLECVHGAIGVGRCRPLRVAGEPCGTIFDHGACAPGLVCNAQNICEAESASAPMGGRCTERPCASDARCVYGRCRPNDVRPYGVCDPRDPAGCPMGHGCVAGRCQPGNAPEGAPCSHTIGPGCATGTVCSRRALCEVPGRAGFACDEDLDCDDGMRCAGPRRTCGHPGDAWHPCRDGAPRCGHGGVCINEICHPAVDAEGCASVPRFERVPCGPGRWCALSSCRDDGVEHAWCRRGDAATSRGDCDPGLLCIDRICTDPTRVTSCGADSACGAGRSCVGEATPRSGCVPIGSVGAQCRVVGARWSCDAGLDCVDGRCRAATTAGVEYCPFAATPCARGEQCPRGMCARDGAPGGRCRESGAACDPGLSCWGYGSLRYCTALASVGDACDSAARTCAQGLTCGYNGRCITDGHLGAACRLGATPCESDGFCRSSRCVARLDVGETCETTGQCREALRCDRGRCAAPRSIGTPGEVCRATAPFCDAGYNCVAGVCRRVVSEGERCGASEANNVCGPGLFCSLNTCARLGALGGQCRGAPPTCDGDLVCARGRCFAPSVTGGFCEEAGTVCAVGHHCILEAPSPRCLRDGTPEARCRLDGSAPCEPGLRCQSPTLRCTPRAS